MTDKADSVTEDKLELFLNALRAIPNDEKGAYLTALDRCPRILHGESCVSRFLSHARGNDIPNSAARLFVDYWEKRKAIFGCSRAFLPMTLCNGALSESCKALINAGWVAPLPKDANGKRVCFLDMTVEATRYQHSHEDRTCCLFYALQVVSEDISAQTQGVTFIILYDDTCYAPKNAIEGFEEILRVMPVKVSELHIIPSGKMKEQGEFFEEFVPRALKTLLSVNEADHGVILDTRQHIHVNSTPQQVLTKLIQCGLRLENLPVKIGGGWTCEHHNAWLKIRLATEEQMIKNSSHSLEQIFFPGSTQTTGESLSSSVRKKRREAKHSRQKRDRKRCRVKSLNLHIKHLQDTHERARATEKNLESALAKASKLANELEANPQLKKTLSFATQQLSPGTMSAAHSLAANLDLRRVSGISYPNLPPLGGHLPSPLPPPPAPSVSVSANGPVSVVVVPAPEHQLPGGLNLPMGHGHLSNALGHPALSSLQASQLAAWAHPAPNAASLYQNLALARLNGLPRQSFLSQTAAAPFATQMSQSGLPFSSLNHPSLFYPGPK